MKSSFCLDQLRRVYLACAIGACCCLAGCLGNIGASGGLATRTVDVSRGPDYNAFTLAADNWIEFEGDLTSAVDSVFAGVRRGNTDAGGMAKEFIAPGLEVLSRKYGIHLRPVSPTPDPEARAFRFTTPWSPWTESGEKDPTQPLSNLNLNGSSHNRARWRGRIVHSDASFNVMTPKRILIHFELEVSLQTKTPTAESWEYPYIDSAALNQLSTDIRKDLLIRYKTFFEDNYSANTESPKFRGFHEIKH